MIYSEIILPPHAPPEYQDRATLWNAVEHAERHKKAQLAYSFDIALQNELTMEERAGERVCATVLCGQRDGRRSLDPSAGQG